MGMKASNKIATFFKYFVLILVGIIMIYPLLWMISATFKDNSEIFAGIGLWIKKPTLHRRVRLCCRLWFWPFRLPRP